jgi:lipopolysaccharide transport system ATP-binding protein
MPLVRCHQVSKYFRRTSGTKLLRDHIGDMARRPDPDDRFYALRDVSFELRKGETLGVIGRNGAGKSTLMNMVTGLVPPDEGLLEVNGSIAALLELGAGFHADLTGKENLQIYASLVGLSRAETERYHDEIVDFAELQDYMDEPLRTYSTGMVLRLAFAVAVYQKADLLVIDELLAVGDAGFQSKCVKRIRALQASGQSLLFVSHAANLIEEFCDSALWLDQGRLIRQGGAAEIASAYLEYLHLAPPPMVEVMAAPRARRARR